MTATFLELETAILQAVVDRDWGGLAELLDDDFVITTAGWLSTPATKDTWVAEVTERHRLHGFEIHSVDVRDLGAVVVVLVLSTQSATWKDAPFQGRFRYTDVWRRDELNRGGSWSDMPAFFRISRRERCGVRRSVRTCHASRASRRRIRVRSCGGPPGVISGR